MKTWVLFGAVLFLMAAAATSSFFMFSLLARNRALAEEKMNHEDRIEAIRADLKASVEETRTPNSKLQEELGALCDISGYFPSTAEDEEPLVVYGGARIIKGHLELVNRLGNLGLQGERLNLKGVVDELNRRLQYSQINVEELKLNLETKKNRIRELEDSRLRELKEKNDRIDMIREEHDRTLMRLSDEHRELEQKNKVLSAKVEILEKELAALKEKKE